MKNLIHEIVTDLKFLFPCIAYEDSFLNNELVIVTETDLLRLYPIKMRVEGMTSIGEDFWGRYTFKDEKDQYYCEVDGALCFKGSDIDGDPGHAVKKDIITESTPIDKDLSEMKPYIDKVKKYFGEKDNLELIDIKSSLQEDKENPSRSKIICHFKVKVKNVDKNS